MGSSNSLTLYPCNFSNLQSSFFVGRNQSDRPNREEEEGDCERAGRLHGPYMAQLLQRLLLCHCMIFVYMLLIFVIFNMGLLNWSTWVDFFCLHFSIVHGGFGQHCSDILLLYPAAVSTLSWASEQGLCAYSLQQEVTLLEYTSVSISVLP